MRGHVKRFRCFSEFDEIVEGNMMGITGDRPAGCERE